MQLNNKTNFNISRLALYARSWLICMERIREQASMQANITRILWLGVSLIGFATGPVVHADNVQIRPDHPDRYVVVKGDTLWDISTHFLKTPWHWPKIWKINEQIANPHLIYPGDVIIFKYVDGKPVLTVQRTEELAPTTPVEGAPPTTTTTLYRPIDPNTERLSPRVRHLPLDSAIPTIPPGEIAAFLTGPLVVGRDELEDAGYVTAGLDDRLILGPGSEFYARGIASRDEDYYKVFRRGRALRDPESGEILAYEAIDLGDARLLKYGDPAKMIILSARQEILPTDRLLVSPRKPALPYYAPHPPKRKLSGWIIAAENSVAEIGPHTVIAISLGRSDGIEKGHVMKAMRHVGQQMDPVTRQRYKLPDEESGLIMVFRVFDRVSYALVMSATRSIHINDVVITP